MVVVVADSENDDAPSDRSSSQAIQLGFSEPIHDAEHLQKIAHRSCNYDDWDGGQIGGICVWLEPEHIPKPIHCSNCQSPMAFICQLYAPLDSVAEAFHRSLYVFACPHCQDHSQSICVLRAQLPQVNPYYPDPAVDDPHWMQHRPETWDKHTCGICGMMATSRCPLQNMFFCSKDHQKEHKRHVFDKQQSEDKETLTVLPSVYTMSELVVEDEPPSTAPIDDERESMFPFKAVTDNSSDSDEDLEQDDLNEIVGRQRDNSTSDVSQDPYAMAFYERLKDRPAVQTQCLRYCRWPSSDCVLWIQQKHQLMGDPPLCEYCSATRRFEFQILPQMLHYLLAGRPSNVERPSESIAQALEQTESWVQQAPPEHVPPGLIDAQQAALERIQKNLMQTATLDWGVLAVYTCTASCAPSIDPELGAYCREYAWRQPSLDAA
jgi:pre-rRNA-processing protein TSR4